jgi:hypoxanthine phosphoribosyltransferase
MDQIRISDKTFRKLIPENDIKQRVEDMAKQINRDLAGRDVLFIGILNGAFIFASDLFRCIDLPARISFVKLASYEGTSSSGAVSKLIGCSDDIEGKTVVIIEDIIDTGNTIESIVDELMKRKTGDVKIAALLLKPSAYLKSLKIDYLGFEISNDFVVGYGLDYNGYGRNLPSVYTLVS